MATNVSIQNLKRGEGAYRTGARTGVVGTTLAAGSATAGHVWACRFPAAAAGVKGARRALIQRFRAKIVTVAGFTAAQEVGLDLFKATAFTALHTVGSAVTPSKKATFFTATQMLGRIATTAELTAGTHTLDTDPWAGCAYSELAAAATVPKYGSEIFLSTDDLTEYPLVLAPDEGLILRNGPVAFAGGGTVRIIVEMDWLELERY